jgi:hypothetical protein
VAAIERFEDIAAWQGARSLVKAVYHATEQGAFARDYALRDQMRRAAVSIMSNIAEGFERNSDKEFRHSSMSPKHQRAKSGRCCTSLAIWPISRRQSISS